MSSSSRVAYYLFVVRAILGTMQKWHVRPQDFRPINSTFASRWSWVFSPSPYTYTRAHAHLASPPRRIDAALERGYIHATRAAAMQRQTLSCAHLKQHTAIVVARAYTNICSGWWWRRWWWWSARNAYICVLARVCAPRMFWRAWETLEAGSPGRADPLSSRVRAMFAFGCESLSAKTE